MHKIREMTFVTKSPMKTNRSLRKKVPPNLYILKLTFAFFAAGMLFYLITMVSGVWLIPQALNGGTKNTSTLWTLTHLIVLGSTTMIAMGASFQLTQVILRTSLYSRLLGYLHFIVYISGVITLIASLTFHFFQGIVLGGILVTLGVFLYAFNLVATFLKKKEWNHYIFGVSLSLLHLFLTVGLGFIMSNGAFQWISSTYEDLFVAHIWFGMIGWLSGLIITYTFKLLPMFYNSPRKAVHEAYLILSLFHVGVWLHVISHWMEWEMFSKIANFSILISLTIFVRFVHEVRLQSRKKNPGGAVSIAYMLIYCIFGLTILWTIVHTFFPVSIGTHLLAEAIVTFLILGWFAATILSYLSKIIPFLWWAYRFHATWKKKSNMLLSDMTNDKKLVTLLSIYFVGVTFVCIAFLLNHSILSFIGQITALLAAIVYIVELLKVFRY